jgi:hypothetical protein
MDDCPGISEMTGSDPNIAPRLKDELAAALARAEAAETSREGAERGVLALGAANDELRQQLAAVTQGRDALAAALGLLEQHVTRPGGEGCVCRCPVIDGHASGCQIIDAMIQGGGKEALAAHDQQQRRRILQDAAAMLRAKASNQARRGSITSPQYIRMAAEWVDEWIDDPALDGERGEVEV